MKVILLKDVPKLGRRGEVKEVSGGHAMNLLLPRGLAAMATPQAIAEAEAKRSHREATQEEQAAKIIEAVKKAEGGRFEIAAKADKTGHLYQKVDAAKIAEVLGVPVSAISLEAPLKEVGEHPISLVFEKVHAVAMVAVVAE